MSNSQFVIQSIYIAAVEIFFLTDIDSIVHGKGNGELFRCSVLCPQSLSVFELLCISGRRLSRAMAGCAFSLMPTL